MVEDLQRRIFLCYYKVVCKGVNLVKLSQLVCPYVFVISCVGI